MLSQFWKKRNQDQRDPKQLRALILDFVKTEILRLEGGEGMQLQCLTLCLYPEPALRFLYETAVQSAEPDFFRQEIQRIADNYAVDLPADWKLEIKFSELPVTGALNSTVVAAGILFGSHQRQQQTQVSQAILKIMKGRAVQDSYILSPGMHRFNIGREEQVQLKDNSIRINDMAFPSALEEGNKYISRQHAHLEWDQASATFRVFADEGGVPPGNKTKIRAAAEGTLHQLNSTQVGYVLMEGDQLILGDQIVISFNNYLI